MQKVKKEKAPKKAKKECIYNPLGLNPWEVLPTVWKTQAAYMSFFRGQLRRAWSRHPMRVEFMKSRRLDVPESERKRLGNRIEQCYQCESCQELFAAKTIEVDHIVPAGSLKCKEDLGAFASKLLFVMPKDLQLLCKTCHQVKSYMDKSGVDEVTAKERLNLSRFKKQPATIQKKLLSEWLPDCATGNPKQREAAYLQALRTGLTKNDFEKVSLSR